MFQSIENKKNKKTKQKMRKEKKKKWKGEELPSGGCYFDSMGNNFHVSKVSLLSYFNVGFLKVGERLKNTKQTNLQCFIYKKRVY